MRVFCFLAIAVFSAGVPHGTAAQPVAWEPGDGQLVVTVDEAPLATYVYADAALPRPYFAHVHAPSGHQVTRNHPPIDGRDRLDHDTMHPGIWLAFGDLNGSDVWRNRARVRHDRFLEPPTGGLGRGRFVERKVYEGEDGAPICHERFTWEVRVLDGGYLWLWDSVFAADQTFYFGDQEEMGLGFRVATPLAEQNGGRLLDAEGRRGAEAIWGHTAAWCDYRGQLDQTRLGITVFAHPDNFRPCWWHARDYGFTAANPFGRQAMRRGELSRVEVSPDQSLRLRFGLWIHSQSAAADGDDTDVGRDMRQLDAVYREYVRIAAGEH